MDQRLDILDFSQMKGGSWLWIDTRSKAIAFLSVVIISICFILLFSISFNWKFLSRFEIRHDAPRKIQLAADISKTYENNDMDIVLFLGGSTTRELTPTNEYFSEQLSALCKRPIQVLNAATSSQSFAEAWLISRAVNPTRLKLVVIGFNYFRLNQTFGQVKLGIENNDFPFENYENLAEVLGFDLKRKSVISQLAWMWNNRNFLHLEDVRKLREHASNPFDGNFHLYKPPSKTHVEKETRVFKYISQRAALIKRRMPEATKLWEEFANGLRENGIRVVFGRLPASKHMVKADKLLEVPYLQAVGHLQRRGFDFVNIGEGLTFDENLFFDQAHLLPDGRRFIYQTLKDQIAFFLPDCN